jgi:hypothetical protein
MSYPTSSFLGMGSLESAIDETFLVDVRALPDEALKDDIAGLARDRNRIAAAYLARLGVLDRRGVAAEAGRPRRGSGPR